MPAPTLHELCKKACVNNVHSFTDVGDLEYHQISDILSYIKSPEQLHQIEEQSPQIKGLDRDLWQKFIAKEIPKWELKNYAPKNPLKWYEIYRRYKREQAEEIRRDEEKLREKMIGIKKARDSNLSKVVDLGSLPKLPRDPRMLLNNGGVRISRSALKKEPLNSLNFTTGSKTKMKDGQSVLIRARREAKEIAQMGKLSRPTHQLPGGQVTKAPAGMVKQYQVANKSVPKILSYRASVKIHETKNMSIEDREKRLLALTSNVKSGDKPPNYVDVGDESESDESRTKPLQKSLEKKYHRLSQPKTTIFNPKQPSNVIGTMITKPISARYVTIKSNNTDFIQDISPIQIPEPQKLPSNDKNIIAPKTMCSTTSKVPAVSLKTHLNAGSQNSIVIKKRKDIDIFNRRSSKKFKAP